jgi:hypothetical protein
MEFKIKMLCGFIKQACKNNDYETLSSTLSSHILFEQNIKDFYIFLFACHYSNLKIIKFIFQYYTKKEQKEIINSCEENKETPLLCAIQNSKQQYNVIKYLIDCGANVNSINYEKKSPLLYAIENNSGFNIIKCLIDHGANVNYVHKYQGISKPILHYAFLNNCSYETIEYLVKNKVDVNAVDDVGNMFSYYILRSTSIKTIRLITQQSSKWINTKIHFNNEITLTILQLLLHIRYKGFPISIDQIKILQHIATKMNPKYITIIDITNAMQLRNYELTITLINKYLISSNTNSINDTDDTNGWDNYCIFFSLISSVSYQLNKSFFENMLYFLKKKCCNFNKLYRTSNILHIILQIDTQYQSMYIIKKLINFCNVNLYHYNGEGSLPLHYTFKDAVTFEISLEISKYYKNADEKTITFFNSNCFKNLQAYAQYNNVIFEYVKNIKQMVFKSLKKIKDVEKV